MSNDEEKEGIVIDGTAETVEPTVDEPSTAEEPTPPPRKRNGGGSLSARLAIGLALVALVLTIAASFLAFRYANSLTNDLASINESLSGSATQQRQLIDGVAQARKALTEMRAKIKAQDDAVAEQTDALKKQRLAFAKQETRLAEERARMEQREGELRESVSDLHAKLGRNTKEWRVEEALHLIELANHRVTLARDVKTAITALEIADQRLRETGDPGWAGVREQLARDKAALAATSTPDIAGIASRITALTERVPNLKLSASLDPRRTASSDKDQAGKPKSERSWKTLPGDLWKGFRSTFKYKRLDQPIQAALSPDQQFFLYENLRLHLETARLALLRGEQKVYADSIKVSGQWIGRFFDTKAQETQSMLAQLGELGGIEIAPELPDISAGLRALKARRKVLRSLKAPTADAVEPADAS